jgi:hypothetical protein
VRFLIINLVISLSIFQEPLHTVEAVYNRQLLACFCDALRGTNASQLRTLPEVGSLVDEPVEDLLECFRIAMTEVGNSVNLSIR